MFIKAIGEEIIKYPYTMVDLLKENPNVSFPNGYENDLSLLAGFNVYSVETSERPTYNTMTHDAVTRSVPSLVDGAWILGWNIVTKSTEEIAQTSFVMEAFIREKRNDLLQETDWMALTDNTLTTEWAAYRQLLRDLPQQEGFPDAVVWPAKPQ